MAGLAARRLAGRVARVGADLPGAALPWPDGTRGALPAAALTLGALVLLARPRWRRAAGVAARGGAAAAWALLAVVAPRWPPPAWVLVMCDVGQGDALVAAHRPGAAVVVDAGPDPGLVDGCLRRLDVDRGPAGACSPTRTPTTWTGCRGCCRGRSVGEVQVGPGDEPPQQAGAGRRAGGSGRGPARARRGWGRCGRSDRSAGRSWPRAAPTAAPASDPNNDSVVVRVEVSGVTLLLTGDVEPAAQAELLASGADLRADVLKVPHHGSASPGARSSCARSAPGWRSPASARTTRTGTRPPTPSGCCVAAGARSFRTDLDGDVAVTSDAGAWGVVGRRGSGTTG